MDKPEQAADKKREAEAVFSVVMQMPIQDDSQELSDEIVRYCTEPTNVFVDEKVDYTIYAMFQDNTYKISFESKWVNIDCNVTLTETGFTTAVKTTYSE